jgi:hypothetical protein
VRSNRSFSAPAESLTAELQWLCDNGAHLLQGFYLARPAANPVRTLVLPEEVAAGADRGRMME